MGARAPARPAPKMCIRPKRPRNTGSGHVDWTGVFDALRRHLYTVGCDRKLRRSIGDLSAAASIWRDIEATPESIAFDGVKFLRRHMA